MLRDALKSVVPVSAGIQTISISLGSRLHGSDKAQVIQRCLGRFAIGIALGALLACVATNLLAQQAPSRRFDDSAKWTAVFDDPARDEWQKPREIIRALELAPNSSVADIGAGTGYFSVRLAQAVPQGRVYAVDVEAAMVTHLAERFAREGVTNAQAVQASRDSPNLPAPVDAVLLVNVQSLVVDPGDYFVRLKERLKPGARVAIVSTRPEASQGAIKSMRRPPEHVKAQMARQGYALYAEHDFLEHQYFLVFKAAR